MLMEDLGLETDNLEEILGLLAGLFLQANPWIRTCIERRWEDLYGEIHWSYRGHYRRACFINFWHDVV